MHFKRRALSVFMIVAMVALAVWGSTMEMKVVEEIPVSSFHSDKETIYFWYSDDALTNYINSAAVAFGEKEDVRVIPIQTSKNDYLEAVNKASLDGEGRIPDAYIINNDSLERAYLAGLAVPVEDEGLLTISNYPRTALNAVTYQNQLIAYPMYFETSALLYNRTYLDMCLDKIYNPEAAEEGEAEEDEEDIQPVEEEASEEDSDEEEEAIVWEELISETGTPYTLDGLLQLANIFDAPEQVQVVFEWNVSDIFYNYWFVGGYLGVGSDTGDDRSQIDINNEQVIGCLEKYKSLSQFFSIQSDKITTEECMQDFIDGKSLFTIATSNEIETLKQKKEAGEMQYEYGFANIPQISDMLSSRSMSVTNTIAVNGYSEHKKLANKFAAFLVDEYTQSLYERSGKISARANGNPRDEAIGVFYEEYTRSISLPKMMEIGNFWLQLEALFSKVWNDAEITPLVEELQKQIYTQLGTQ